MPRKNESSRAAKLMATEVSRAPHDTHSIHAVRASSSTVCQFEFPTAPTRIEQHPLGRLIESCIEWVVRTDRSYINIPCLRRVESSTIPRFVEDLYFMRRNGLPRTQREPCGQPAVHSQLPTSSCRSGVFGCYCFSLLVPQSFGIESKWSQRIMPRKHPNSQVADQSWLHPYVEPWPTQLKKQSIMGPKTNAQENNPFGVTRMLYQYLPPTVPVRQAGILGALQAIG